jgi:enoyl-CoA hydratase/carnithine racemase
MSTVESDILLSELSDGILTLTLNRPERLNAMSHGLLETVVAALDAADRDDAVKVIIFTGAGRGFCAGTDLSGGPETFRNARTGSIDEHKDIGGVLTLRIFNMRKPVIAAINGPATGIGITLTLPCDVRLAANTARMGFVFARRGIAPDACSSWFAPRIVGISQALRWFMSGRVFDAQEALAGGLVSEVLEPAALMPRAREIARELMTDTSAVSVGIVRRLLWQMQGASGPEEAMRLESRALWHMGLGADSTEGVASFLEKRAPRFAMKVSEDFPDLD